MHEFTPAALSIWGTRVRHEVEVEHTPEIHSLEDVLPQPMAHVRRAQPHAQIQESKNAPPYLGGQTANSLWAKSNKVHVAFCDIVEMRDHG